jgi:ferredoxin-fold anticodon binding domain-containing protein
MKELEELRVEIGKMKGIESIVPNVVQIGYSFDTWRDKLVLERSNPSVIL